MSFFSRPATSPRPKKRGMGFTLLEALVVVALLGILVGLTAPAMTDLRARHRLQGLAESFLDSLVLARSEALRRQQKVTVCARTHLEQCDSDGQWQQGWLVFVDTNNNGLRESGELLLDRREALPQAVHVLVRNTVKSYFSYNAEGRSETAHGGFMAGSWRFCRTNTTRAWQVVANALGKPRIESFTTQSCP